VTVPFAAVEYNAKIAKPCEDWDGGATLANKRAAIVVKLRHSNQRTRNQCDPRLPLPKLPHTLVVLLHSPSPLPSPWTTLYPSQKLGQRTAGRVGVAVPTGLARTKWPRGAIMM
jgi:hypothetical protein